MYAYAYIVSTTWVTFRYSLGVTPYRSSRSMMLRRAPTSPLSASAGIRLSYAESSIFFFFNDTATPEIYPLSLPDALPISFLEFGIWNFSFRICRQRLAQRRRHRRRHEPLAVAFHARHLSLAARHQFLRLALASPVFERDRKSTRLNSSH